MTRSEMGIEEWAAAATAEFEDEPARRSIARVAIAAVTCAVIFAFVGSQLISHGAEFFERRLWAAFRAAGGGFWDLWSGTPLSEYQKFSVDSAPNNSPAISLSCHAAVSAN